MGRKANFRDTTQIDRKFCPLNYCAGLITETAFFRLLGSVFLTRPIPNFHRRRLSVIGELIILSLSSQKILHNILTFFNFVVKCFL